MKPSLTTTSKLGALAADLLLPTFLVLGLLVPIEDAWRNPFELALLPILAWLLWRHGLGGRRVALALLPPLAWIAWLGASGGWGSASAREEWDHHSLAALMTAIFFVMCVVYVRSTPLSHLGTIAAAMVVASAVNLVAGVTFHVWTDQAANVRLEGIGLFEHEILGSFLAVWISLLAVHLALTSGSTWVRAAMAAYLPIAFVHIFLTGSRAGVVVCVTALAGYLLLRDMRSARPLLILGALALAATLAALLVLIPEAPEFLRQTLSRQTYRLEIWQTTVVEAAKRPFLGLGIGDDTLLSGRFKHPHNLHLANLFYGGIPAAALGVFTLATGLLLAWRVQTRHCRPFAIAALWFVFVSTLPDTSLPISKPGELWHRFWVPLAVVWGLSLRPQPDLLQPAAANPPER